MSSRYDVIGPNTLEAIRRDSEITRLKDRIEKLEAALQTIYDCCDETGNCSVVRRIVRKVLEGKDGN